MKILFPTLLTVISFLFIQSCDIREEVPEPLACFEVSSNEVFVGDQITFNAACSENAESFGWKFGDGNTITGESVTYIYEEAGQYEVSLKAYNKNLSDETSVFVEVKELPEPVACFEANTTQVALGDEVAFTNCSEDATEYMWDFGDGSTATAENPQHTYSNAGMYTVSLTARSDAGENTETKSDYITVSDEGAAPVADFEANKLEIVEGESLSFTDKSVNVPTSWKWEFGDGGTSTQQNPSYTYNTAGTYTVSLTVTNESGNDTEAKADYITVVQAGDAPVAAFSADKVEITEGGSITFTDESTNNPTSWSWDFGDGGTLSDQNPSYTYNTAGTFTVSLTVTNESGNDTETKADYITVVQAGDAPVAAFSADKVEVTEGGMTTFTDESTNNPTSWSWDFGDGGTSSDQNPSYTYNTAGTYTVSLTVTNESGNDTEAKADYITVVQAGDAPVAAFSADKVEVTEGGMITFTDESTNNPTSWSWDFGDGGTSTEQSPTYTYNSAGTYTVSLTVTNEYGNDTETKTDYITVIQAEPPLAAFTSDKTEVAEGETIAFTDESTNNPTSWSWDFGDGGTSTEQNPVYTYNTLGTYAVSLTVTNEHGSDTETKTGYVTVAQMHNGTLVVEITNPATGKTWMDRNLGAAQVATSSYDAESFGDLYQWGRGADGHEKRNSDTISTLSSTDSPGHGAFILVNDSPNDWRSPQNDMLWQGIDGINNPCPNEYRLPTQVEWEAELQSWNSIDRHGAFESPLKLTIAGGRSRSSGSINFAGTQGYYWSSTIAGVASESLGVYNSDANSSAGSVRAYGYSVRCIKD